MIGPPGLLSLAQAALSAPPGHAAVPGFEGQHAGRPFVVTAVLDLTAVLQPKGDPKADKILVRQDWVFVDPAAVEWRPRVPLDRKRYRDFVINPVEAQKRGRAGRRKSAGDDTKA